jgi:hypothetical protein
MEQRREKKYFFNKLTCGVKRLIFAFALMKRVERRRKIEIVSFLPEILRLLRLNLRRFWLLLLLLSSYENTQILLLYFSKLNSRIVGKIKFIRIIIEYIFAVSLSLTVYLFRNEKDLSL